MPSALNAALLALWACLMGYVLILSPNQTPSIDSFVVQKLCGCVCDRQRAAQPTQRCNCKGMKHSTVVVVCVLCCARLKPDDPFQVNAVFTAVWNCMGLYPLIWASILVPGSRGEGKVRATAGWMHGNAGLWSYDPQ